MITQASRMMASSLEQISNLQPPDWNSSVADLYRLHWPHAYFHPMDMLDGNRLIGVGELINLGTTAWLGNIIIADDYRRRGLGQRITQALIDDAIQQGVQSSFLLATAMGTPLYARMGFQAHSQYLFFVNKNLRTDYPADPQIRAYQTSDENALRQLDLEANGEDRWSVLTHFLKDAKMYAKDGAPLGFFLPYLGDGLVMARKKDVGIALLKERARTIGKPYTIIPESNKEAIAFLEAENYKVVRYANLMHLGPMKHWEPRFIYSRIGGYLG